MKVRNYELSHDDELLYITYRGKTYYTEYSPKIEFLLSTGILGSFSTNGKRGGNYPKFDLGPPKRTVAPYLHHIIYCAYYRGLNEQNYLEVLGKFRTMLHDIDGCIDHLHSGVENCCISNLHLMENSKHKQKTAEEARRISRLRKMDSSNHIFHIVKANDGDRIRVQIVYISSSVQKKLRQLQVYCVTDDELTDFLEYIRTEGFWNILNRKIGTPYEGNNYAFSGGILTPPKIRPQKPIHKLQHELLEADLTNFVRWRKWRSDN